MPTLSPVAIALAGVFVVPVVAIFLLAITGGFGDWPHLSRFVLPHAMVTTAHVLAVALVLSAIWGVGGAWLVAMCTFPGRRLFAWMLILPLAMPTYVAAYFWTEALTFSGPLQTALRALTGWERASDYWFPRLSNPWGLGALHASVLFPYVYLSARLLFALQARSALETARSLGAGHGEIFQRIALPMARPAIFVGLSLVAMETLNDIGAADYLGVDMLARAVFDTWLNRGSLAGAAQLSLVLLAIVALLITIEVRARRAPVLAAKGGATDGRHLYGLYRAGAFTAAAFCTVPIVLGMVAPLMLVTAAMVENWSRTDWPALFSALWHSVLIASLAASVCLFVPLVLVGAARQSSSGMARLAMRAASLGYAVPGTILGLGTLYAMTTFDRWASGASQALFGTAPGLLLTGSVVGLVFVSAARFMAMTQGSMSAAMEGVSRNVDQAGRSLGQGRWGLFWHVHAPLLLRAGVGGALLVFVDALKELSATLIVLPFDFQTLATWLFGKAQNSQVEQGAAAALAIVLAGLVPVIIVSRTTLRVHEPER